MFLCLHNFNFDHISNDCIFYEKCIPVNLSDSFSSNTDVFYCNCYYFIFIH